VFPVGRHIYRSLDLLIQRFWYSFSFDKLLPAIDVIGRVSRGRVAHDVCTTDTIRIVHTIVSVRESLELLIENEGWRSKTCASAQEFLDHPRTSVPSCLVLDLSLPDLNGLEQQKCLAVERTGVPIIFITGHGDIPKRVQAMKGGALEFLTKPINSDALASATGKALERSRLALARRRGDAEAPSPLRLFTSREQQAMALVVSGL
jgi:FixJ family two-component response regulator